MKGYEFSFVQRLERGIFSMERVRVRRGQKKNNNKHLGKLFFINSLDACYTYMCICITYLKFNFWDCIASARPGETDDDIQIQNAFP